MKSPSFKDSYNTLVRNLLGKHDEAEAMAKAVGGAFEAVGVLEACLLRQCGLQPGHTLVDVGCGSGRLAYQLRDWLTGPYVGIDVVPELHRYAQRISGRKDWRFHTAPGLTIPEPDASADFICFFSVFTHLLHQQTFEYLRDSRRVLKPGGRIVFSFLEFRIFSQYCLFRAELADPQPDRVLTQFMDRDAIARFAEELGLEIVETWDGDKPHIPLDRPVTWDDGRVMEGTGNLGQSVCVLRKP